jgi:RND family efflux transporter MFP subunit
MRVGLTLSCLVAVALASWGAAVAADSGYCMVQPSETVAVTSPVEGLVERITVDRGDVVQQGQVLVTLESSTDRASVALARARAEVESPLRSSQVRLDFGVRRLVRTEEMYRKELIPLREMDEAETAKVLAEIARVEAEENRRLAELEHERAAAALALRTIRSPIAGVVLERSLAPGESTGQGPILRIARLDPLRIETSLPFSSFGRVRVGTRAQVSLGPPLNSRPQVARVTVVDRVVDPATGTFGVRLELPNPDYRLPAGLPCSLRFLAD